MELSISEGNIAFLQYISHLLFTDLTFDPWMFGKTIFDDIIGVIVGHKALMFDDHGVMNTVTKNTVEKSVIMKIKSRIIIRRCHHPHQYWKESISDAGNVENLLA